MSVAIHINPTQEHQREHYEWFAAGLKRHGIILNVTHDLDYPADIHIISGPHYAKKAFLGQSNVILIDRAYYHEGKSTWKSMDWISLGWMRSDGGRRFICGTGRKPPVIRNNAGKSGTIFLADYNGPVEEADTVRLHPSRQQSGRELLDDLHRHHTAIGYQTTALVAAAIEGLEIICKDKRNILAENNWLELLPYADWKYNEIESGEAWEHLLLSRNQLNSL
jgi:hypothetical protein